MTRQGLLQTQMGHDFNEKFVSDSHWENWANFIPQLHILWNPQTQVEVYTKWDSNSQTLDNRTILYPNLPMWDSAVSGFGCNLSCFKFTIFLSVLHGFFTFNMYCSLQRHCSRKTVVHNSFKAFLKSHFDLYT